MTGERFMPATETFAAGLPVEVGQIDRELKKLWDAERRRDDPRVAHQSRGLQ